MAATRRILPTTPRDPAAAAQAVTPSNSAIIKQTRGLYIGQGGNLVVRMANSLTQEEPEGPVVFYNVPTGAILPLQVCQVLVDSAFGTSADSTTCDLIVALY